MMDLPTEDLEEYVEKFENVFSNQKLCKKNKNELLLLTENISAELNISRKSEIVLGSTLKQLLESENVNLNKKYVKLKEKCDKLEEENVLILKQKEELINNTQKNMEAQKNDYLNKIKFIEEKYLLEITNLKNQIESDKICYAAKEQELYTEMQMSQAATALEWDEKEAALQRQIAEAKSNLQQCQNANRKMKCEVNYLRNQLNVEKSKCQNTLYFQETPIQQIKSRIMQEQFSNANKSQHFELDDPAQNETASGRLYSTESAETEIVNNDNTGHWKLPQESDSTHYPRSSSAYSSSSTIDIEQVHQPAIARPLNISRAKNKTKVTEASEIHNRSHGSTNDQSVRNESQWSNVKKESPYNFPAVYKGSSCGRKTNLPPPIPLRTNVNGNSSKVEKKVETQRKKRKLYDPNEFNSFTS